MKTKHLYFTVCDICGFSICESIEGETGNPPTTVTVACPTCDSRCYLDHDDYLTEAPANAGLVRYYFVVRCTYCQGYVISHHDEVPGSIMIHLLSCDCGQHIRVTRSDLLTATPVGPDDPQKVIVKRS